MKDRTALDDLLLPDGITSVCQPVYRFTSDGFHLDGVECLSRGRAGTNLESPKVLFEYVRLKRQEIVVDRVCVAAALREAEVLPEHLRINVNVHASTLGRDEGFPDFLQATASAARVALPRITVEIVEHAPPWDTEAFLRALDHLRAIGARIALDDVGLGQSNFKMLLDVGPDYLKLDRYFVDGCADDPRRCAVIDSIQQLARQFGAEVVAEGIERREDLEAVRTLGVTLLQGFLLSPPVHSSQIGPICREVVPLHRHLSISPLA